MVQSFQYVLPVCTKENPDGKKQRILGTEPIGKLLLKLAIPTVVAQLVNMLYNIVDRVYLGHMPADGSLALTGVGVCTPIILFVSAFAALICSSGAPRSSIFMGQGDYDKAEETMGNCFTLQIVVSLLLTVLLTIFGEDLLWAFGASENTIGYATRYLGIYALGTLFVQLTLGMNYYVTAQGFSKVAMKTVSQSPPLIQVMNIQRTVFTRMTAVTNSWQTVFTNISLAKTIKTSFN